MLGAESREGRVVWWGIDPIRRTAYSGQTNGVIEFGDEILSNVVAIAAQGSQAVFLKSDGTVFACGSDLFAGDDVPAGLSNVVSVAVEGNSCWAIRRDGSVARWGNSGLDNENIVAGLSNITAIVSAGYRGYLALKPDGTVLGFRLDRSRPSIDPMTGLPTEDGDNSASVRVKVGGEILRDVMALVSMGYTPLVLKSNGTVLRLGYQTPGAPPAEPA